MTALPEFGITGVLVIVIVYLLTANARDRSAHERTIQRLGTEHAAELTAARTAHETELDSMRKRLASLEQRLTELETELDRERDRRRAAEDTAAAVARRHP